jgi:hypothetical protein
VGPEGYFEHLAARRPTIHALHKLALFLQHVMQKAPMEKYRKTQRDNIIFLL